MVVARLRLEVARRRGAPDFPFAWKVITTQARCVPLAAARVASLCESYLSMESSLVALSTTRGGFVCEGASIRVQDGLPTWGDRAI